MTPDMPMLALILAVALGGLVATLLYILKPDRKGASHEINRRP